MLRLTMAQIALGRGDDRTEAPRRLQMRRWAVVLLFAFLSRCSTSPGVAVRLDTGHGEPIVHTPRRDVEPVQLSETKSYYSA